MIFETSLKTPVIPTSYFIANVYNTFSFFKYLMLTPQNLALCPPKLDLSALAHY